MLWLRNFCLYGVIVVLAGCGFKPVYKQDSKVVPELKQVAVTPIKDQGRAGQILETTLEDLLNPTRTTTEQAYTLDVAVNTQRQAVALERSREITRYNIVVTAHYTLKDAAGKQLKKAKARAISSYDAVISDYANFASERDGTRRAMKDIAHQIRSGLVQYFDQAS